MYMMTLLQVEAYRATGNRVYIDRMAATMNMYLDSLQQPNGLFEHCAFQPGQAPYTHTIAYTTRGLLESGFLLAERRYILGAERCARAILSQMNDEGHLPATIATDGRATSSSCCLTGNCQFAIVWARLHAVEAAARSSASRIFARRSSRRVPNCGSTLRRLRKRQLEPRPGRYQWRRRHLYPRSRDGWHTAGQSRVRRRSGKHRLVLSSHLW
jgi:hypothetical protein